MKDRIVAKVIKIGNSKGLRLNSKDLAKVDADLGDEIEIIQMRKVKHKPDTKKAIQALRSIAERGGPLTEIDVDKWMRERDKEWAERKKEFRDILGR